MNRAALDRATAALDPPFAVVDLDAFDANAADLLRRARRHAAAAGQQVGALPRAAAPRARRRLRGAAVLHAARGAVAGRRTASTTSSSPTRPPTAPRCARWPHGRAPRRDHGDGRQPRRTSTSIEAAARRPGARLPGRRRRLAAAGRADQGRRQALARAHARAGRRAGGRRGGAAGLRARRRSWPTRRTSRASATRRPAPPLRRRGPRHAARVGARELAARRAAVVAAVRARARPGVRQRRRHGHVERTAAEAAVTEVTAGSGLYGPTLFDAYRAFDVRPAALFALPVVRKPVARDRDRARRRLPGLGRGRRRPAAAPVPARRPAPGRTEGAGEVQTPLLGPARARPRARRPGVVSSRQGRRAVRALRQPAPRAR